MSKFKSRKFIITMIYFITTTFLLFLSKIDSFYYLLFNLIMFLIFIFVEGTIDFKNIKNLKISQEGLEYERIADYKKTFTHRKSSTENL